MCNVFFISWISWKICTGISWKRSLSLTHRQLQRLLFKTWQECARLGSWASHRRWWTCWFWWRGRALRIPDPPRTWSWICIWPHERRTGSRSTPLRSCPYWQIPARNWSLFSPLCIPSSLATRSPLHGGNHPRPLISGGRWRGHQWPRGLMYWIIHPRRWSSG